MMPHQSPSRKTRDYVNLNRWLISNHFKTEDTKPEKIRDPNPITRFLHQKIFTWLYHYLKSRFVPRHKFMTYAENGLDKGIYRMISQSDNAPVTIALVSDWATDTTESRLIGEQIKQHRPDYTIHLGDTYFVGTPEEVERNFYPGHSPWAYGAIGSFALAGNHEMYSNGNPYFDQLLAWMGLYYPERIEQKTSYICLENEYWRIIGLDTGFRSVSIPFLEALISKSDLHKDELEWLKRELKIGEDNKGIIFLTHHQPVSAFSRSYLHAPKQLSNLVGADREVLWFWGHEHRYAMYGKNKTTGGMYFYGRCIGHGGMPVELHKHPDKILLNEENLVLYDNRFRSQIDHASLGHNGYALLKIDHENLVIEYHDEKTLLVSEWWTFNKQTRSMEGQQIICHDEKLERLKEIRDAIS